MTRVVVIGAGIGGLTTAAILARAGYDTTVLEAHVYPGGCAGTFYHQGYRFDAGATLAGGFYPSGPMDLLARAAGLQDWPARPSSPAMQVHLPGGLHINRWEDDRRWEEYRYAFGEKALAFWRWQERTADVLWDLALRIPAWPPQSLHDFLDLANVGASWVGKNIFPEPLKLSHLAVDAFTSVENHLRGLPDSLRLFVDAQLLISAQATSSKTNALYGASALDLPRRGVLHFEGGMGTIANLLVQAVRKNQGQVHFRQEVSRIRYEKGTPAAVETKRGDVYDADLIIANLPPWNIATLTGEYAPRSIKRLSPQPPHNWGAFVLYLGVDASVIPTDFPLHHQLVLRRPLGEGNTLFLSISPEWDAHRAPSGHRAITMSTHTDLTQWWSLFTEDPEKYKARRAQFAGVLLSTAESILPGLRQAADLILPGTPVTFQRFTRRALGWVGGFQQTSLFQGWAPKLGKNLWMVGDSIFPGQSVAATALGGIRVAGAILREQHRRIPEPDFNWKPAS